jgi:hypothetical protein
MSFVKLDCGILNSTLWVEREQREIFITALLMALPHETKEPIPQLRVNSIELTGFQVPPGWYGFVEAAGPGIVRRAMCDMTTGMQALALLGEPDHESRSSEFAGRRLVRVDGGYIVLNFMKYRDRDNTASVRAQRYRDRKKLNLNSITSQSDVTSVTRDSSLLSSVTRDSSCGVTIAEAEAEAEKDLKTIAAAQLAETPVGFSGPAPLEGTEQPKTKTHYRVPPCPTEQVTALYAEALPQLAQVSVLTRSRKTAIASRWREVCGTDHMTVEQGLEWFEWFFGEVAKSQFLTGRKPAVNGHRVMMANLDWLMKPDNFAKTLDGNYRDRK